MQSLFSRVRSTSKHTVPHHSNTLPLPGPSSGYDEFGQERSTSLAPPPRDGFKRDKSKTVGPSVRQRTLSAPGAAKDLPIHPSAYADPVSSLPENTFHPTYLAPKRESDHAEREYGYLGAESQCILGVEDVQRLVAVVGDEILQRALTTPLLFSSQALDVSANRVRSLVRSFLTSCNRQAAPASEAKWREDARLAGPHELGMVLRWGLARVLRRVNHLSVRGLLDWDTYVQWKLDEEGLQFPANHFPLFLDMTSPSVRPLISNLFNIFSRLSAYSAQSGLTPIAISNLFGPLLFGLGAESLPFSQTYAAYLRSSHATEHLLLSYIRLVEVESRHTASPMPSRLKDWIRGYPVMIPPLKDLEKPRRGCKLIKVASTRRNVRMYSTDLVKSAAGWAMEGDVGGRKEWLRVTSKNMAPKYTDEYKKRLDIPLNYAPSISSYESKSSLEMAPTVSITTTPPITAGTTKSIAFGLSLNDVGPVGDNALTLQNTNQFRSLTDLQWGRFEELGFRDPDVKKLEFDLNEGARMTRSQKRTTLSWNDFSAIGFLRDDVPLSETLQFSYPISSSISAWPSHADDIHRKLKKTQKVLPQFGWDTTPVAGQEWTIEEGFVSCWADLLLSSGWMTRYEGTFRDSNWALVELKALPVTAAEIDASLTQGIDPRTSSQWFLFEEFVPREYRDQLLHPPKKTAKTLFSSPMGKGKGWKPASTLNGKPYNGRPRSPNDREAEFDAMLRAPDPKTRLVSLSEATSGVRSHTLPDMRRGPIPNNGFNLGGPTSIPSPLYSSRDDNPQRRQFGNVTSGGLPSSSPVTPSKEKSTSALSRFRLPGSASKRNANKLASDYDPDLEFETKTASDSSGGESPRGDRSTLPGHSRRQSKDDAWVDILVSDRRRLGGQDAIMDRVPVHPGPSHGGLLPTPPDPYYEYQPGSSNIGTIRTPRTSLTRAHSDPEMSRDDSMRATSDFQPLDRFEIGSGQESYAGGRSTLGGLSSLGVRSPRRFGEESSYVSSEDEEEVMEVPRNSVLNPPEKPQIRVRPASESSDAGFLFGAQDVGRPQSGMDADDEEDFEPAPPVEPSSGRVSRVSDPRSQGSRPLPPSPDRIQDPLPPIPQQPSARTKTPGAVGSLIEMYAKRDEEAMKTHYEPKASRLPVRSTSGTSGASNSSSSEPFQVPSPARSASPHILEPPEEAPPDAELEDSLNRMLNPSPGRYVHGAPLHNVIEEESEE
ncbi:hypothetical protein FRB99_003885 [Tulasnella sp. 403]|nr:hypothetical protein FRB99_003885 [Tulasnella sp. 403]